MRKFKFYLALIYALLVLLNIPTVAKFTISPIFSSIISDLMMLIGFFLIVNEKNIYPRSLKIFYLISLLFYSIGLISYSGEIFTFINEFIKYTIFVFALFSVQFYFTKKQIFIFFVLGACTIIADAFFLQLNLSVNEAIYGNERLGRYAGFYINANSASAIALTGYCICSTSNYKLKSVFSLLFTLVGLLTFSRTFIFSWILINLILFFKSFKNLVFIAIFIVIFPFILSLQNYVDLRTDRLDMITNLFSLGKVDGFLINSPQRYELSNSYSKYILDSPIIGNGFDSFRSGEMVVEKLGVHNTFLVFLGEAGFLPFMLILFFLIYLLKEAYGLRNISLFPILLWIVIFIQFNVSHTFFNQGFRIFMMTFLIFNIYYYKNEKNNQIN